MISTTKQTPIVIQHNFFCAFMRQKYVLSATSQTADCSGHIKPCSDVGDKLRAMTWGNTRYCRWMAQRHQQGTNCAVSRRNRRDPHTHTTSLRQRNMAFLAVDLTIHPWQPYHLTFLCRLHQNLAGCTCSGLYYSGSRPRHAQSAAEV